MYLTRKWNILPTVRQFIPTIYALLSFTSYYIVRVLFLILSHTNCWQKCFQKWFYLLQFALPILLALIDWATILDRTEFTEAIVSNRTVPKMLHFLQRKKLHFCKCWMMDLDQFGKYEALGDCLPDNEIDSTNENNSTTESFETFLNKILTLRIWHF